MSERPARDPSAKPSWWRASLAALIVLFAAALQTLVTVGVAALIGLSNTDGCYDSNDTTPCQGNYSSVPYSIADVIVLIIVAGVSLLVLRSVVKASTCRALNGYEPARGLFNRLTPVAALLALLPIVIGGGDILTLLVGYGLATAAVAALLRSSLKESHR